MKKWLKRTLIAAAVLVILLAGAFFVYVSDYYRADAAVTAMVASDSTLSKSGDMIVITPAVPYDTALIFYPGGKVEYTAYVPMLKKLADRGVAVVLVKMPFNLAVFDVNAADRVYGKLPSVKNWYIGGHSLGGAMASSYAAGHADKIKGLILLGAYIYGDVDPRDALTVYGTMDLQLDLSKIDYDENVVVLEGGNHAQFGDYGAQKGDGAATITRQEQQERTVQAILAFIGFRE
jgi:pimeloyl-ACP methyl ester carboxylesterase